MRSSPAARPATSRRSSSPATPRAAASSSATASRRAHRRLRIAVSDQAHSSVKNTLSIIDVDPLVVRTADHRFTGDALRAALDADPDPESIVAVVATSRHDQRRDHRRPAPASATVARERGLWFHVDGAYGGAGLFAPSVRDRYDGIELADSFIVDPHKWLFAPFDCAALLYREPWLAKRVHTQDASYLDAIHHDDGSYEWNPTDYAYHLTRRARGLPLWFSLVVNGTDAYTEAIEHSITLARAGRRRDRRAPSTSSCCASRRSASCSSGVPAGPPPTTTPGAPGCSRDQVAFVTSTHVGGRDGRPVRLPAPGHDAGDGARGARHHGMIGAVGQTESTSRRAPLEPVTEPRPDDHPALFGDRVKATRAHARRAARRSSSSGTTRAPSTTPRSTTPGRRTSPRTVPPAMLGRLLVELTDAEGVRRVAGVVSWHRVTYGPNPGSHAWNIGIGLAPASRGHGVGAVAQRLLAEWLLATTSTRRIEASTDVANVAEQKALERAGFTREGVLRSAQRRADGRHDLYSYSLLPDRPLTASGAVRRCAASQPVVDEQLRGDVGRHHQEPARGQVDAGGVRRRSSGRTPGTALRRHRPRRRRRRRASAIAISAAL